MDTPNEPEPQTGNTHDAVVAYTIVALLVAGAATALWGPAEKSARGFRMLDWLGPFFKAAPETPESDQ
ncbi:MULTISPECIES: hypothetical protein [Streptomyces]|uniref:hypothetical protein n=1 Tax=Streptomyces TaxID=1883 RepID=UPI000939D5A8|nr:MULTISPECIES: hypothetical protein [Streptomyces]MBX9427463.1 hypothetical protein [Streptomyces lateritius]OKJ64254.1 hypothetical protein AMK29_19660 [Streptomyces sp. CB02261]